MFLLSTLPRDITGSIIRHNYYMIVSKLASAVVARRCTAAAVLPTTTVAAHRMMSNQKNLVTHEEGVHQTMQLSKSWRNKPLFRRQGDVRFRTGMEASKLLIQEADRRDAHEIEYIESISSTMECLSPLFDRLVLLYFFLY